MQRIPIKFAEAGMVLVKPVIKGDGMVLAGEGMVLSDTIISRLRNAAVPSLVVKGRPLPNLASGLSLPNVLDRLPHLFRKHSEDPLMKTLYGTLERFLQKAIAQEEEERRAEAEKQIADPSPTGGK